MGDTDKYSVQAIVNDITAYKDLTGRFPRAEDCTSRNGLPSAPTIVKYCGSLQRARDIAARRL
jgi:hypothetical protein